MRFNFYLFFTLPWRPHLGGWFWYTEETRKMYFFRLFGVYLEVAKEMDTTISKESLK